MKKADLQFGPQQPSIVDVDHAASYGRFTIRNRKTDNDPSTSCT